MCKTFEKNTSLVLSANGFMNVYLFEFDIAKII